ncbi:MAG TPA: prepilin-type N-terminal cleavage/methylation domain-containing protein [Smithella sp.]|nr:prepilin-type N-terminal cleavage/methylation domain-containing protein [Smithella sp.]
MRLKSTKGFSVIELLIVIAIIAIVTVIAVPNFTKYRYNSALREAAQEIVADLQLYKKRAVAEHRRYLLYYPPSVVPPRCYVYTMDACTSGMCYDWPWKVNKRISDDNAIIVSSTDPYPYFQNNTITGYCWAFVVLDRRGTMGEGSLKLRHMKTNSTATINTKFLGRIYVTYNMQ